AKAPRQQVWAIDVDAGAAGKAEPRLLGDMGCDAEGCEEIRISPDGRAAVWVGHGGRLWLAPLSGASAARQLHGLQGGSSQVAWSPDGLHLAFVLDRKDYAFLVVYDLATEALLYIAPGTGHDQLPRWSPDGRWIAFVREPPVADRVPLIPPRSRPWAVWVAAAVSGAAREVWHSRRDLAGSLPHFAAESFFFAEGGQVVFASEHGPEGRNHLYSVAIPADPGGAPGASGAPATPATSATPAAPPAPAKYREPVLLTPGDYDVEDVALSADGRSVLFSANEHAADPADEDRRHLWRVALPAAGADDAPGHPQALTRGTGIEWAPVETGDGKAVLCLGSTATTPGFPYRITASGREILARDAVPAGFPAAQLVVPRQVFFRSADGVTLHAQLFLPRDAPAGGHTLPALIFTHGGPVRQMLLGFHYMQYYHNAYAMNQLLASRGYAVLSLNYRLGIMYGRAFREVSNGGWRGAAEYQDLLAAAQYLRSLPAVDSHRIGLWGGSYGGYLTAMGLARDSDLFAAGVDFHGVHDWSAFLPGWGTPAAAPDAAEASKLAFASSPISAIATWRSPVLLIHGGDDRNVPFSQTRDLAARLLERGVPFEEIVFPDEIHDLLLWRSWVRGYAAAADFFDRHLREPRAPRAAPASR
ncbi:MAG: prolyl oligopeptidase family serine peptidase, partial [Acidobacteriota bacterium]|nr:prolyl oligopeptidase family serine peptidase [Acidobacteriota bacterium]